MRWRSYPKYKDTGVKWICEIPEHWRVKRIKHTTYVKGRIGWQGLKSDEFIDEGPHLVTGTDFEDGRINWKNTYHISEERYKEDPYIQLQEEDLLITKDGTIGKIAIVRDLPGPACLNSGIFVTRPTTKEYLTDFIYWMLNSDAFAEFIDFTKTGSTISHLYQNIFVEFSYPIPSLSEQNSIVAFLDRKIRHIDILVDKKKRQMDLLQEKRAALISHAVTKSFDPSVPMKDSGLKWLGEIPSHWKAEELNRHWKVIDCKHRTASYVDEGIPIVSTTEVKPGRLDLSQTRKTTYEEYMDLTEGNRFPKRGDIIYTRNASLGSAAYVDTDAPFCMGQDVCLIKSSDQNQLFLNYQLNSSVVVQQLEALMVGATFRRINIGQIKKFVIIRPPKEEQQQIAKYLDEVSERINILAAKIKGSMEMLKEYRSTTIFAAVTGKIDVRQEAA